MKDIAPITMKMFEDEIKFGKHIGSTVHACARCTIGGLRSIAAQFNIDLPTDSLEFEVEYGINCNRIALRWQRFLGV